MLEISPCRNPEAVGTRTKNRCSRHHRVSTMPRVADANRTLVHEHDVRPSLQSVRKVASTLDAWFGIAMAT